MWVVGQKRKHVHKTPLEKAQGVKDIEKGLSKKEVAAKYNVKRQKLRGAAFSNGF